VQFQNQEQLLEEARRDLDMYKKAFFDAERAKRDLEERFEEEKQALNDEIRQLRECSVHGLGERFGQGAQALNDGIPQLKVRLFPPSCPNARVFQVPPLQTGFLCDDTVILMVVSFCLTFRQSQS